jgi:hypothetical protein
MKQQQSCVSMGWSFCEAYANDFENAGEDIGYWVVLDA